MKISLLINPGLGIVGGGAQYWTRTAPAITPATTGSELITNGGFEGTYVDGLAPGWTKSGSPTVAESGDAHAGTAAQSFAAAASGNGIQQSITVSNGTWLKFTCYGKRTAGTAGDAKIGINDGVTDAFGSSYTEAAYTQKTLTFLRITASFVRPVRTAAAGGDAVILDDASCFALDLSTMLSFVGSAPQQNGTYMCKPIIVDGAQGGIACCYTDINNFLLATVWRGRSTLYFAALDVRIAGTWTRKIFASIPSYADYLGLSVIVSGTSASLFYNGAQVGTTADITGIGLGRDVYAFSTSSSNAIGEVTITPKTAIMGDGTAAGVLFQFDDGWANCEDAVNYLITKGLTGTIYQIGSLIDTANYFTTLQLQTFDAAGISIANHTDSHTVLSTLTEAQQEAEMLAGASDLVSIGLADASKHLAFPNGSWNVDTLTALKNTGMLTGRFVLPSNAIAPAATPSRLIPTSSGTIITSTTLASLQTGITNAINAGLCYTLLFHQMADVPGAGEWANSNFYDLVDWVVAQGYRTLNIEDLYNASSKAG